MHFYNIFVHRLTILTIVTIETAIELYFTELFDSLTNSFVTIKLFTITQKVVT